VKTYVLRVWVPDRPGALGAVASRIGAVRGDVVGIEILERGGGSAIDELVVEMPDDTPIDLLIGEIRQVEGTEVEDLRPLAGGVRDAGTDALETAALLLEESTPGGLFAALAGHAHHDFDADWVAVIAPESPAGAVTSGPAPPTPWLSAFVGGSRSSSEAGGRAASAGDVAWAPLEAAGLAIVLGRAHRPFRERERRQLTALARVADRHWWTIGTRVARGVHPSAS
jgi:hypothetical protein